MARSGGRGPGAAASGAPGCPRTFCGQGVMDGIPGLSAGIGMAGSESESVSESFGEVSRRI